MSQNILQPHHLPLNTSERYWIALSGKHLAGVPLEKLGFQRAGNLCLAESAPSWLGRWHEIEHLLEEHEAYGDLLAAIIPAAQAPGSDDIMPQLTSYLEMQSVARSLWLGEALLEERVVSFFQPIVDGEHRIFGYEAFARVRQPDASLISGYAIMAASKVLKIEFRLDRYLQQRSICAFGHGGYPGRLFINFFAGFIQRPEFYLDGIAQELERCGVSPKDITLDLAQPEDQRHIGHLKSIADFCHRQGYGIALDNIRSRDDAAPLIDMIGPHFIKLDHQLTKSAATPVVAERIAGLVDLTHRHGAKVIGEGVESAVIEQVLKASGVDLFQGYHIGAPMPGERHVADRAAQPF